MIDALRSILSQSTPVNLRPVALGWDFFRVTERRSLTSGTKAEITQFSAELLNIVCYCVSSLKSPQRAQETPKHTSDGQVTVDHILRWQNLQEPLVLIEDKSTKWHLRDLLSVPEDLFRRTEQWNWEGIYSIIAKLSWKATHFPSRYCKWAIVYSGDQFLIYHILRISEPNNPTPTVLMTYSDAIAINDTETPYTALLVYMMLSADEAHSSLATMLHVNPPQGTHIVDELGSESEARSGDVQRNRLLTWSRIAAADCAVAPALSKASEVTVTFMPKASAKVVHKRVTPEPEYPPSTDSPILTLTPIGYGAIGVVYRAAEGCVVKFSRSPKTTGDLVNEAGIYAILQASNNVAHFIPRSFGLFRNGEITALILSNEGTPIMGLEELSLRDRKQVYTVLACMHKCGVLHGDFRPANVLYGPHGPILIDFSHSKSGHVCPLDGPCWELRSAQTHLRLTEANLVRKRTWMAFELSSFLCLLAVGGTAALLVAVVTPWVDLLIPSWRADHSTI